jgi:hypothetical protein
MNAKDYKLVLDKNLWYIKFEGGGQLSKELSGGYSRQADAKWAIECYEAKKKPSRKAERKVKDGQSKNTGRT